ncbi:MAG: glycosyltransferase [Minisyncoccia bacterium]
MATRILYVITKANWGGAQRYVYDLATAAKEAGHEVAVAYGEAGVLSANLYSAGIQTIEVPALAKDVAPMKDIEAYKILKDLFSKNNLDVVHLNSAKAAGLGALAARRSHVPHIIFTAHGWAFNEERPFWQRILIWLFSGITVLLSHKTICVSEAVRRDIKGFPFISRKLAVIHNGIVCPVQLPRDEAREAILPNHGKNYWVGMVSELHTTKRISDGVRAFAKIKDEFPNAIFVGIGEGGERGGLEELITELGVRDRVFLPGFIPDVKTKLSAFDLFVHTSRSEALGYAVLEAGCASLPVISTNVGGIPEIIMDEVNGLLIPPFRPDLVADKIRDVIQNPELSLKLSSALKARVESTFSLSQMAHKTFSLYR